MYDRYDKPRAVTCDKTKSETPRPACVQARRAPRAMLPDEMFCWFAAGGGDGLALRVAAIMNSLPRRAEGGDRGRAEKIGR